MSDKQTWCGNCGIESETLAQWNQGATSSLLCPKCVAKKEESAALAQQIIAGTAPATTPDFGAHCDAAVAIGCAMFPDTFKLRGHAGTFRVSRRASYVSRGRLMLYTQRFYTEEEYKRHYCKENPTEEDRWVDFAKGTISELKGQVVR